MKYSEINANLASFWKLTETIPEEQIQGAKVARNLMFKIEEMMNTLAEQEERITWLEGELFGKKKNKEDSQALEDDSSQEINETESRESKDAREKKAKKKLEKARGKDKVLPKGTVKSQKVRRRIPNGMFCCECQSEVQDLGLGHKASEIDLTRVKVIDREYLLHRGSCPCGAVQIEMPRPERAIERSNYSPDLVSQLIISKFKFHLPIYRQQKQLLDAGIFIHRSVLNDLVLGSWKQLKLLVKHLKKAARKQSHRYVDETPICRVKGKKSYRVYLWGIHTSQAIYFELTDKRNQKIAKEIIGPGGTIMTDGLGIYCEKSIDGKHGNCLAHALQKLFRSFSAFPDESDRAVDFLVRIYDIEREAKAEGLADDQRRVKRQEESAPIMDEFKAFLESLNPPPRSNLGKAINYCLERWEPLTLFLQDGALDVDNNRVEALFRDVKLGLKNFLFVQSELGGEALAGFYSIIATCELHNVNPALYLADIFRKISRGFPQRKIDELMPWNWQKEEGFEELSQEANSIEQEISKEALVQSLGLSGKVYFKSSLTPEAQEYRSNSPPS